MESKEFEFCSITVYLYDVYVFILPCRINFNFIVCI